MENPEQSTGLMDDPCAGGLHGVGWRVANITDSQRKPYTSCEDLVG